MVNIYILYLYSRGSNELLRAARQSDGSYCTHVQYMLHVLLRTVVLRSWLARVGDLGNGALQDIWRVENLGTFRSLVMRCI